MRLNSFIDTVSTLGDAFNQLSDGGLHTSDNLENGLIHGLESHLTNAVQTSSRLQSRNRSNAYFGLSASQAKLAYQKLYSHEAILQCNYAVQLWDIYNIGKGIPWFAKAFPISWLATEVEMSIGSGEAENFYAGSYQANYMTQQTSDTLEITFIETKTMGIAQSAKLCKNLIFNNDGTVNEPKKYTFVLGVGVFDKVRNPMLKTAVFKTSYLVAVKEASFSLSSTGRSEIIKTQVTFQKIRPYIFK